VRMHASVPARQFLAVGIEEARPAPGVLEAIEEADVVLLPPSNPVVSIGTILASPASGTRCGRPTPRCRVSRSWAGRRSAGWPTPA